MGAGARIGAILAVAALAGCGLGQSRLNPMNWFGGDRDEPVRVVADAPASVARPVVDQVLSLRVDPTPGGVIVSAVGLPPTQGFWEADLRPVPSADPGVLVLEFGLLPPVRPRPAGTQPSREVLAGAFLSSQDLGPVRRIAVQGARNSRSVARR